MSSFKSWLNRLLLLAVCILLPSCVLVNLALTKAFYGCVPEGTQIDTASGTVQIEELKTGDTIIGFSGNPVQILQIHQYQEDPTSSRYLNIQFSNEKSVRVSPRHRIDGKPAGDLKIGDSCGSHEVTDIQSIQGVSRSYDLLTEDSGYRIGGVPVNSMINEMLSH